jgi:hypothetical protein
MAAFSYFFLRLPSPKKTACKKRRHEKGVVGPLEEKNPPPLHLSPAQPNSSRLVITSARTARDPGHRQKRLAVIRKSSAAQVRLRQSSSAWKAELAR